ncbi:hypothetical protein PV435_15625 [Streptomyces scabiei]|nr:MULTISPECIES: hypothetical protein [Streptomyces]MDX3277713.1 hypothetical protein [Streptomyces scabiei]MDX3846948.1 hypothetical protein [Streptomyces europaeiscabiei]
MAAELRRISFGLAEEDDFDPVVLRCTTVMGTDVLAQPQHALDGDIEAGLLKDLTANRVVECLAGVRPPPGRK